MQYCSLQHWTLLPSPVTSTTGYCFCFGSVSSFFMELFLYSSPVAYWVPTNLGVHLSVSYIFAFSYCSWGSPGKNTGNGLPFPPVVDHVFSGLFTMICPSWVALHSMAHNCTELHKPLQHNKAMIHEGVSSLYVVKNQC